MINPAEILSWQLRPDVDWLLLLPLALSLAGLLSYAAFTDLYRGRIIRNWTSLAVVLVCWSVVPLIFVNPFGHFLWGLLPVAISLLMYLAGGQGGGDLKLYLGLGPLFGPFGIFFFFISALVILVYALPMGIKNYDRQRPFGQRMGATPAAPGIALAVPLSAWLAGAPALGALVLLLAGIGLFLLWRFWPEDDASANRDDQPSVWPQEYLQ